MPVGTAQSLITRCPGCGTAFRASGAQLEARAGQVRCGRCGRVFDGLAHAIELPASPAEPPSPAVPEIEPLYDSTSFMAERLEGEEKPTVVTHAGPFEQTAHPEEPENFRSPVAEVGAVEEPATSPPEPIEVAPFTPEEPPLPEIARPETAGEQPPVEFGDIDLVAPPQAAGEERAAAQTGAGTADLPPAFDAEERASPTGVVGGAEPELFFVGPSENASAAAQASPHEVPQESPLPAITPDQTLGGTPPLERQPEGEARETAALDDITAPQPPRPQAARPSRSLRADEPPLDFGRRKPARSRLAVWESAVAAVLLLLALAGQIAYSQRANLLVLFPAARPAAERLCADLHCDLPYPRRADLMSIESSNLQADTANPAVMVLTATLRNRAPFPQAQPALELTLTDAQDQALARRVLGPVDYGAPQGRFFPAASEQPVKLYFDASAVKATGYRLYLFYP